MGCADIQNARNRQLQNLQNLVLLTLGSLPHKTVSPLIRKVTNLFKDTIFSISISALKYLYVIR